MHVLRIPRGVHGDPQLQRRGQLAERDRPYVPGLGAADLYSTGLLRSSHNVPTRTRSAKTYTKTSTQPAEARGFSRFSQKHARVKSDQKADVKIDQT